MITIQFLFLSVIDESVGIGRLLENHLQAIRLHTTTSITIFKNLQF